MRKQIYCRKAGAWHSGTVQPVVSSSTRTPGDMLDYKSWGGQGAQLEKILFAFVSSNGILLFDLQFGLSWCHFKHPQFVAKSISPSTPTKQPTTGLRTRTRHEFGRIDHWSSLLDRANGWESYIQVAVPWAPWQTLPTCLWRPGNDSKM